MARKKKNKARKVSPERGPPQDGMKGDESQSISSERNAQFPVTTTPEAPPPMGDPPSASGEEQVVSPDSDLVANYPYFGNENEQLPLRALGLWQEGNRLYKEGNYHDSISMYTEAILLSASYPSFLLSLLHNRALAHLRAQQHQFAVEDCDSIHLLDDSDVPAWIIKMVAFLHLRRFQDAIAATQATEKVLCTPPWDPTEVETRPVLQKLNYTLNQYQKQFQSKKKKQRKTGNLPWDCGLGILFLDENSVSYDIYDDPASQQGPRVVEEKQANFPTEDLPDLIPAGECLSLYFSSENTQHILPCAVDSPEDVKRNALKEKELGNQDFGKKKYESSLVHYSRAIQLNPFEPIFYTNRALVYLKLNRSLECIADCSASIHRRPTIKAYHHRAAASVALGWYERAAEEYRKALDFEPRNASCMSDLHKCLKEVEMNGTSSANLELIRKERSELGKKIEEVKKSEIENERMKAEAMEANKMKQAITQFCKQLSFDPCNTQALLGRATAYEKLGQLDKSVLDLRLACRLDPDNKVLQEKFRLAKARLRNIS